jgi:acetyl-CoA synthetase
MPPNQRLSTLKSAFRVLDQLKQHPEGLEAAAVAALLGKSLSAAYALLASLAEEGLIERNGSSYRLTRPSIPLREHLKEALEELYLRTRERSYLALPEEGGLWLLSRGRQGLPRPYGPDRLLCSGLHALALGKVILAFEARKLEERLEGLTPFTLTDPLALQEELSKIRQLGLAVEIEEFALGYSGIAVPILREGKLLGALGVALPARRFPFAFHRLAQALFELAGIASRQVPSPPAQPAPRARSTPRQPVLAPLHLRQAANWTDYEQAYQRSLSDPGGFWGAWAQRFVWQHPFRHALGETWFEGGLLNLAENALRHAQNNRRNQIALIAIEGDGTRQLTYRELREAVRRLAGWLWQQGLRPGDRVGVYLPNTLEAALTLLACAWIGAIHVVLPPGLGASSLRERLLHANVQLLVAAEAFCQRGELISLAPTVEAALEGLDLPVLWHRRRASSPFWRALESAEPLDPQPLSPQHPLFLLYTSGSTGKPKGVLHTHAGILSGGTYALRMLFDLKDGETFWATAELPWIVGHVFGLYAPLLEGLTTLLKEDRLDHPDLFTIHRILETYGVNVLLTNPTWLRRLRQLEAAPPHPELRLAASVGEHLAPEVWQWSCDHLAHTLDNWWQTETGAPCLSTPLTLPYRPGKVGVPLPGIEALVVDPQGTPLPPGSKGELALRVHSPQFMQGFWPQGEVQRGLYLTGDLAVQDEAGYFTLLGRSDDVIKLGDQRIGAAEVENCLLNHPAVAEAAAIGLSTEEGGRLKAFVVLRSWESTPEVQELLADRLRAHLRSHLGLAEAPIELAFVKELPRTKSGKILRRLLKAREIGQDPGDLSTLESALSKEGS